MGEKGFTCRGWNDRVAVHEKVMGSQGLHLILQDRSHRDIAAMCRFAALYVCLKYFISCQ